MIDFQLPLDLVCEFVMVRSDFSSSAHLHASPVGKCRERREVYLVALQRGYSMLYSLFFSV